MSSHELSYPGPAPAQAETVPQAPPVINMRDSVLRLKIMFV